MVDNALKKVEEVRNNKQKEVKMAMIIYNYLLSL